MPSPARRQLLIFSDNLNYVNLAERNVVNRELPADAPDPGRQCLHAERLTIKHPRTHEDMQFEAELPADMVALLRWLRSR